MKNMMGDFDVKVIGDMPEHCDIQFNTTGTMGGDAGHGGNSSIRISQEGGASQINIDKNDVELFTNDDNGIDITFTVSGDWEMYGLVAALIRLGDKLRERYGDPADDEDDNG